MLFLLSSFQIISILLNLLSYHRLIHVFRLTNTNCLKLIPSSESGTLSAFYGHRKFHNRPPLATVLGQTNPFHSFDFCIFKIHFSVIRSTQVSKVGLLTSAFPTHQNTLTIFLVRPACHIYRPSQSPCFVIVTIFGNET